MAPIRIAHVVSCSSQDENFPAENLINSTSAPWLAVLHGKPWLCNKNERPKCISVEFQLEKEEEIEIIDIGNYGTALVEIMVGRSSSPSIYQCLLPAFSLMTPQDSRAGKKRFNAKMFSKGLLLSEAVGMKWDRIKVSCSQPHSFSVNNSQFGLSFLRLYSPSEQMSSTDCAPSSLPIVVPNQVKSDTPKLDMKQKWLQQRSSDADSSDNENEANSNFEGTMVSRGMVQAAVGSHKGLENIRFKNSASLDEEFSEFLRSLDLFGMDLVQVTVYDLRRKFEKKTGMKLSSKDKVRFRKSVDFWLHKKVKDCSALPIPTSPRQSLPGASNHEHSSGNKDLPDVWRGLTPKHKDDFCVAKSMQNNTPATLSKSETLPTAVSATSGKFEQIDSNHSSVSGTSNGLSNSKQDSRNAALLCVNESFDDLIEKELFDECAVQRMDSTQVKSTHVMTNEPEANRLSNSAVETFATVNAKTDQILSPPISSGADQLLNVALTSKTTIFSNLGREIVTSGSNYNDSSPAFSLSLASTNLRKETFNSTPRASSFISKLQRNSLPSVVEVSSSENVIDKIIGSPVLATTIDEFTAASFEKKLLSVSNKDTGTSRSPLSGLTNEPNRITESPGSASAGIPSTANEFTVSSLGASSTISKSLQNSSPSVVEVTGSSGEKIRHASDKIAGSPFSASSGSKSRGCVPSAIIRPPIMTLSDIPPTEDKLTAVPLKKKLLSLCSMETGVSRPTSLSVPVTTSRPLCIVSSSLENSAVISNTNRLPFPVLPGSKNTEIASSTIRSCSGAVELTPSNMPNVKGSAVKTQADTIENVLVSWPANKLLSSFAAKTHSTTTLENKVFLEHSCIKSLVASTKPSSSLSKCPKLSQFASTSKQSLNPVLIEQVEQDLSAIDSNNWEKSQNSSTAPADLFDEKHFRHTDPALSSALPISDNQFARSSSHDHFRKHLKNSDPMTSKSDVGNCDRKSGSFRKNTEKRKLALISQTTSDCDELYSSCDAGLKPPKFKKANDETLFNLVECPICQGYFPSSVVEAHAASCEIDLTVDSPPSNIVLNQKQKNNEPEIADIPTEVTNSSTGANSLETTQSPTVKSSIKDMQTASNNTTSVSIFSDRNVIHPDKVKQTNLDICPLCKKVTDDNLENHVLYCTDFPSDKTWRNCMKVLKKSFS